MIDDRTLANLLAYSAQVACIVALGTVAYYLLRIDLPRLRHAYWRSLLALCLLLPLLQAWPAPPEQPAGAEAEVAGVPPVTLTVSMRTGRVQSNEPVEWAAIAVRVVAAGIVLRLLWTALGLWQLLRLRRTGEVAEFTEHADLKGLVGALAEIRYVRGIDQPVTFGMHRPVIVLPEALRDHPEAVQRAVICHELFHVRRRDWVWVLAEEAIRAAFWFNPAVWWVISRIQLTREEAVDAAVVELTGERKVYLEALLAFADAAPLTPAAAFSRRRHLFTRMVLISKEAGMSSRRIVASCAVLAAAIAAGSWYAVQAFPLQGGFGGVPTAPRPGQVVPAPTPTTNAPGPLELAARPITPENPIPRRTSFVPVELPADTTSRVPVLVIVRATIDDSGRVAEARMVGVRAAGRTGVPFALTGNVVFRQEGQDVMAPAVATILGIVKQWRYDPPFEGPLTFDVTIPVWLDRGQGGAAELAAQVELTADRIEIGRGGRSGVTGAPAAPAESYAPIRVGGAVKVPQKTKHVNPEYPAIAQSARVQGVVILEAVIGDDGRIQDARILRSIPLLDQAARDAVMQWEFTPTLLNGQPVPVIMTVTVQFSLPAEAQ